MPAEAGAMGGLAPKPNNMRGGAYWHPTILETRVGRIHVKRVITKHHSVSQIPKRDCLIMFKYKCIPNITTQPSLTCVLQLQT